MSPEWCIPDSVPRELDVHGALDNLGDFIEDVQRHPPMPYQHEPQVNVADLQVPLGPAGVERRSFTLNHHLPGGNEQEYTYWHTDTEMSWIAKGNCYQTTNELFSPHQRVGATLPYCDGMVRKTLLTHWVLLLFLAMNWKSTLNHGAQTV